MRIETQLSAARNDPALLPFLESADESEAEQALARLLSEEVNPLVKQIVRYKLRGGPGNENSSNDVEDVCSETLVNLLTRLNEIRSGRASEGIRNLHSYVAVAAYRACYEHLRRKYPKRHSLKNKLRYLLTHQPGFELWETAEGEWLAGLSGWSRHRPGLKVASAQPLPETTPAFQHQSTLTAAADLKELLTSILRLRNRAIELDELVGIVAEACQIKDQPVSSETGDTRATLENVADERRHIDREVDSRMYLERLWDEISRMSAGHCAALLLNLKDAQGACAIELFLITGVASFKQLADAIGQTEQWLATIWNRLPVDDLTIAAHLGVGRQRVINLRKFARRHLAKRMAAIGF
jgi:DNA-directed RNA polymerase specialized sigma24 family protein